MRTSFCTPFGLRHRCARRIRAVRTHARTVFKRLQKARARRRRCTGIKLFERGLPHTRTDTRVSGTSAHVEARQGTHILLQLAAGISLPRAPDHRFRRPARAGCTKNGGSRSTRVQATNDGRVTYVSRQMRGVLRDLLPVDVGMLRIAVLAHIETQGHKLGSPGRRGQGFYDGQRFGREHPVLAKVERRYGRRLQMCYKPFHHRVVEEVVRHMQRVQMCEVGHWKPLKGRGEVGAHKALNLVEGDVRSR